MDFRVFKMIATSGFLPALECTKFIFGRGSTPDPAGEAYSAPLDPLAEFKGYYFQGTEREGGKGKVREGRVGE